MYLNFFIFKTNIFNITITFKKNINIFKKYLFKLKYLNFINKI